MDPRLTPLFERAFERVPAAEANARIEAARTARPGARTTRSYEIVVPEDASLDWLRSAFLPRLVYHLECLGARPPAAPGVFVSFFVGAELFLIDAREVIAFASDALQLSSEEMLRRFGTGESRGPVAPATSGAPAGGTQPTKGSSVPLLAPPDPDEGSSR